MHARSKQKAGVRRVVAEGLQELEFERIQLENLRYQHECYAQETPFEQFVQNAMSEMEDDEMLEWMTSR